MVGGSTAGYSRTPSRVKLNAPKSVISTESTIANTGRRRMVSVTDMRTGIDPGRSAIGSGGFRRLRFGFLGFASARFFIRAFFRGSRRAVRRIDAHRLAGPELLQAGSDHDISRRESFG